MPLISHHSTGFILLLVHLHLHAFLRILLQFLQLSSLLSPFSALLLNLLCPFCNVLLLLSSTIFLQLLDIFLLEQMVQVIGQTLQRCNCIPENENIRFGKLVRLCAKFTWLSSASAPNFHGSHWLPRCVTAPAGLAHSGGRNATVLQPVHLHRCQCVSAWILLLPTLGPGWEQERAPLWVAGTEMWRDPWKSNLKIYFPKTLSNAGISSANWKNGKSYSIFHPRIVREFGRISWPMGGIHPWLCRNAIVHNERV